MCGPGASVVECLPEGLRRELSRTAPLYGNSSPFLQGPAMEQPYRLPSGRTTNSQGVALGWYRMRLRRGPRAVIQAGVVPGSYGMRHWHGPRASILRPCAYLDRHSLYCSRRSGRSLKVRLSTLRHHVYRTPLPPRVLSPLWAFPDAPKAHPIRAQGQGAERLPPWGVVPPVSSLKGCSIQSRLPYEQA